VTCYDWNVNGCTNAGNRELEWYAPSQVTVGGGAATLSSVRKPTVGGDGRVYSWASGMLSTGRPSWAARPRFTFTYGYVEASIRMPAAAGMFPAFWLLTGDETVRPEVDIAELIASHTHVLMNLHWTTSAGTHASAPRTFGPVDFSAGYHDFAVDWEPSGLTWYVDGIARYAVTDRLLVPARPMELLFTLAVGFPGPPPADVSTASMSIEHVRIWQR
jgi:beta-glucanase (GH16 family)